MTLPRCFHKRTIVIAGAAFAAFCAYTVFLIIACKQIAIDSDKANHLLQADDMLHGNMLLSGWILSGVTFFTTDLPIYCVAEMFGVGVCARTLHIANGLMISLPVAFGLAVAVSGERENAVKRACIYAAITALPTLTMAVVARVHSGSICLSFLALIFAARLIGDGRVDSLEKAGKVEYVMLFISLVLGMAGDMLTLLMGVSPILMYAFYALLQKSSRELRHRYAAVAVTAVGGLVSGIALEKMCLALGGADKNSYIGSTRMAAVDDLGGRLLSLVSDVAHLCGGHFFGLRMLDYHVLLYASSAIIVLAATIVAMRAIYLFLKLRDVDVLTVLVSFLCVSTIAAYLFSGMSEARYITVLPLAGGVLIARTFTRWYRLVANKKLLVATTVLIIVLEMGGHALSFLPRAEEDEPASSYVEYIRNDVDFAVLAKTLDEHGLSCGYSSFWNASSVSVLSEERVCIRAVVANEQGLSRFRWFCKEAWFEDEAHFIVVDEMMAGSWHEIPYNLTKTSVVDFLGNPDDCFECDGFVTLVYNRDISKEIRGWIR